MTTHIRFPCLKLHARLLLLGYFENIFQMLCKVSSDVKIYSKENIKKTNLNYQEIHHNTIKFVILIEQLIDPIPTGGNLYFMSV